MKKKILPPPVTPKDIRTDHEFMGSVFQNSECETILRNIVMLQQNADPDNWTPFTYDQYKEFCTHTVRDAELRILTAFVEGGQPAWNTSAYLSPGWLYFENNQYSFSEKMIQMLAENYSIIKK